MVVDALIRKSSVMLAHMYTAYVLLLLNLKTFGVSLECDGYSALVASFVVRPTLVD